jgi:hypothetical protein
MRAISVTRRWCAAFADLPRQAAGASETSDQSRVTLAFSRHATMLDMPEIVLRDEKTATDIRRLIVQDHEGGLRLDGWDLGDGVQAVYGSREYEWTLDVAASDLPALVTALGGAAGEDVFEVIRRTCADAPERLHRVIVDSAIPHVWWHRIGD